MGVPLSILTVVSISPGELRLDDRLFVQQATIHIRKSGIISDETDEVNMVDPRCLGLHCECWHCRRQCLWRPTHDRCRPYSVC